MNRLYVVTSELLAIPFSDATFSMKPRSMPPTSLSTKGNSPAHQGPSATREPAHRSILRHQGQLGKVGPHAFCYLLSDMARLSRSLPHNHLGFNLLWPKSTTPSCQRAADLVGERPRIGGKIDGIDECVSCPTVENASAHRDVVDHQHR